MNEGYVSLGDPDKYLGKYLPEDQIEGVKKESVPGQEAYEVLREPIGDCVLPPKGKIEIENDCYALNMELRQPAETMVDEWGYLLRKAGDEETDTKKIKLLTRYRIENKQNGQTLDIFDGILPSDFNILFLDEEPDGELRSKQSCFASFGNKILLLPFKPTSPLFLLSLLHEAGHIADVSRLGYGSRRKVRGLGLFSGGESNEQLAVRLECERNAWSFAVRKLLGFFMDDSVKGGITADIALDYIKNGLLSELETAISQKLNDSQQSQ